MSWYSRGKVCGQSILPAPHLPQPNAFTGIWGVGAMTWANCVFAPSSCPIGARMGHHDNVRGLYKVISITKLLEVISIPAPQRNPAIVELHELTSSGQRLKPTAGVLSSSVTLPGLGLGEVAHHVLYKMVSAYVVALKLSQHRGTVRTTHFWMGLVGSGVAPTLCGSSAGMTDHELIASPS
jgi:hypothetical protein